MDLFYAQIGFAETWLLFSATIALIAAAHYMSFRQALALGGYNWRATPVLSALTFAVKHEFYYLRKVPQLIGSILLLVTLTVL